MKFEGSRFCLFAGVCSGLRRSLARGLGLSLAFVAPLSGLAEKTHYVFAHYMVCYATYGQSVAGYEQEIQQAQAAGIDGFVLDIGVWNDPVWTYYNTRVALIYQAAEQLGTGFKLSFFVEFSNPTNIINLVETYGNRTNTFRYNGDIVLSSWGMNEVPTMGWVGVDWTNAVLGPLREAGYPVFFIPHFWPPNAHELPSYSDAETLLAQDGSFIQGLFLFGAAGLPYQLAECNSNYTVALHAAGKMFMASVTPNYWGDPQTSNGRRYFETDGGEGTILQWRSIIENQPDWVNLVTWSDFGESTYWSPVMDPEESQYGEGFLATPHRYCHAGYLELSKYYITWYKTGRQPQISNDSLYYFYRTHPKNAVALNTNDIPVTWFFGDVEDDIYNTVFLKAPAKLEVSSGGTLTTNSLPAGISNVRTPFNPGPQWFTLSRGGSNILTVQGPDILSQITNYDFFPASGYADGPTNAVSPPTNLKASGQ